MKLTSQAAVHAFLSAAFLFVAAAPSHAQAAIPVGSGGGAFVATNQVTRDFSFSVVQLPNGEVRGHGSSIGRFTRVVIKFDVTSYMLIGDLLVIAGPITQTRNGGPQFVVGRTAVFAVRAGTAPGGAITGLAIFAPNATVQSLVARFGGTANALAILTPALRPLVAGNIVIH